ncbi:MAG TPA: ferrochelatase [Chthonomonadales bacterium]|nr:ferrochelatase [Chthonomonadales bacterium]
MSVEAEGPLGVLLMAHGTPDRIKDVEAYYTDIRRGRPPSPQQLADLVARYERVGGTARLRAVTFEQAEALRRSLSETGVAACVQVAMKHWRPSIAEAMRALAAGQVRSAVGVVLAPHYSRLSVGQYVERAEAERALSAPSMQVAYVERWGLNPSLIELLAGRVREGLAGCDPRRALALFTAHSLPERIRTWGDPYEQEVTATAGAVASALSLPLWRVAWQSAGATPEPWIGPDVLTVLREAARERMCDQVLVCPVGFTADNLEVLYNLDVEAAGVAADLGLGFRRTPSLNAHPGLIAALQAEVLAAAAWLTPPAERG